MLTVRGSMWRGDGRRSQRGVALIITVIMLSVITFLAVAFLALSGREKGAVKQTTDQTTARLAADTAMVRAQADFMAGILASRNLANFNLRVSTNYQNWRGYDTSLPIGVPNPTNVNYYDSAGNPLGGNNALQNLANLLYSPAVPVFITNRLAADSMEFRSYIDLNRSRRLDLSGFWGVTNNLNQPLLDNSNRFVTNYVVGDPQWIGVTERIELPHSSSNKFTYRFAYAAVPIGQTLDLNYIHNNAKLPNTVNGFLRNQGVGTWEINLAAFLADLNTNYWNTQAASYNYYTNASTLNTGTAFDDAYALWTWRRGPSALLSVQALYGGPGVSAFANDWSDGYSAGLVLDSLRGYTTDPDVARTATPWSGADMENHFFTPQDLFDPGKAGGAGFSNRLGLAGTQTSTYDQNTYYRLLSQLGTESAPDDVEKLNLNYKNVGGYSTTNFVPWTTMDFFTNAAERLLAKYTQDWLDTDRNYYTNFFGTNQAFGITSIPVWISNRFVYTPSVHRLLQLAANIADTKTNGLLPSVFRPIFERKSEGLYIVGYQQVPTNSPAAYLTPPIKATNVLSGIQYVNVYGVPWVLGAKQGLPNFNEISMHSMFEITRKLQVVRASRNAPRPTWQTNLMYVAAISNAIGVEAWNSYRNNFTNPVAIRVSGELTMTLTNELGLVPPLSGGSLNRTFTNELFAVTNFSLWRGYGFNNFADSRSFVIPLRTNITFLPESAYRFGSPSGFTTNLNIGFERATGFPQPQWGLTISGRLCFVMQLGDINGPVIDYVQLDNLDSFRQLSEEIRDPDLQTGFDGLWSTNLLKNSSVPQGVFNQMDIALGNAGGATADWKSYGKGGLAGSDKDFAIDYFRVMYGLSPLKYGGIINTSLVQQVPFNPTKRTLVHLSWQANDPLVHYTAGDLLNLGKTNTLDRPKTLPTIKWLPNIGRLNERYSPWGGNPENQSEAEGDPYSYSPTVKDPLVMRSDDWQFPTNALPNVGWLGRIHRGTPWQTVYLKSSDLNIVQFASPINNLTNWLVGYPDPASRWANWSGNPNFFDAYFTRPATDRLLFDIFTTAVNDNASRGQLSVNQTNLAAWSAVFSGVVALSNSTATPSAGIRPVYNPLVIEPAGVYNIFGGSPLPALVKLVSGINAERNRTSSDGSSEYLHSGGWFKSAGDILSVPALSLGAPVFVPDDPLAPVPRAGTYYWTNSSPFLNFGVSELRGTSAQVPTFNAEQWNPLKYTINDAALEWLPQQIMSLVRVTEPRFVIYAYGQALRPAENSIVTLAGPFFGMCTNYQITAEVASRAVVRVEGSADPADANNANPKRRYPPRLIVESYNYLPPD